MGSFAPNSKPNPTILVVEDEPGLRFLVTEVLEDDGGFNMLIAKSADEAFELIAKHQDIRCVFTDVKMPGQFDGLDLANEILSRHPHIKVVITSGNSYSESPIKGVPFLPKPYDLASIPERLRTVLST